MQNHSIYVYIQNHLERVCYQCTILITHADTLSSFGCSFVWV